MIDFEKYVNFLITIFLPEWFLKKYGLNRNPKALDGYYEVQTDKAIFFKIHPVILAYHKPTSRLNKGLWIPKSLIISIKTIKTRTLNDVILKNE